MTDYIFFIILFVILFILFTNATKTKTKTMNSNEKFQNTNLQDYHTYILSDSNEIKYELITFSQLNFDLQKKILNKIINNEIFKNDTTENFQNINSTSTTQFDINNIFNNTFSLPEGLNIFGNNQPTTTSSMPNYEPPTTTSSMPNYEPPTTTSSMPNYEPPTTTSSMPNYEPPTTTYSMPNYEPPTTTYSMPNYEPPTTTYSMPNYVSPTTTYSMPNYVSPTTTYSMPNYEPSTTTYSMPNYVPPTTTYSMPNYVPPTTTYSMPNYVPPTTTYSMPNYAPPTTTYSMPNYVPPTTTYSMPNYAPSSNMQNDASNMSSTINSMSQSPPNLYKRLIDIELLQSLIEAGSKYNAINDIVFAVRLNRMQDDTIISYNQELLFDENKDVNYSLLNHQRIKKSNSILSSYNGILSVSLPDDPFNIKKQNEFKKAIINDNKISFKNIRLTQIEELPIYLIDLTDKDYNIKIEEQEVVI
jgi:hypothetical protein